MGFQKQDNSSDGAEVIKKLSLQNLEIDLMQ